MRYTLGSWNTFIFILFILIVFSIGFAQFLPSSDAILDESKIICREEMALIKRTFYNDYVCTSQFTAIRWDELGIGEIVSYGLDHPSHIVKNEKYLIENTTSSILKLPKTKMPITIPMHKGYYEGSFVYYIVTDSSEKNHAQIISEKQGWSVHLAPALEKIPNSSLSTTYMFTNGVKGNGIHGYQGEVFTSTPAQPELYSPFTSHIHVTWNSGTNPVILNSEDNILLAVAENKVRLSELNVVLNMPQISWPEGQMEIRDKKTVNNNSEIEGGQIISIDKNKNQVKFMANRAWGPDGKTIYYILIDGAPIEPTEQLGILHVPYDENLEDLATTTYQFTNGINGTSGFFGFQPPIFQATPDDSDYNPICKTFLVDWFDIEDAFVLENLNDFEHFKDNGLINVTLSTFNDSIHMMNCPQIDPFE